MPKLNAGDRHLLRLIRKDKNGEGWSKVSKVVWPLIVALSPQLVDIRATDDGGFVKLTHDGEIVLDWE